VLLADLLKLPEQQYQDWHWGVLPVRYRLLADGLLKLPEQQPVFEWSQQYKEWHWVFLAALNEWQIAFFHRQKKESQTHQTLL
jgi:hypothetical protein